MSLNRSNTTDGSRQQRLNILGQDEIDTLFRRPCFTDEEREQYFTLSSTEQEVLDELKTTKSKNGENEYVKIKKTRGNQSWSLRYPGDKDEINHPFFDSLKQVGIGSVLYYVNQRCRFMDAFEHLLDRYVKTQIDERAIFASLLGYKYKTRADGTNIRHQL